MPSDRATRSLLCCVLLLLSRCEDRRMREYSASVSPRHSQGQGEGERKRGAGRETEERLGSRVRVCLKQRAHARAAHTPVLTSRGSNERKRDARDDEGERGARGKERGAHAGCARPSTAAAATAPGPVPVPVPVPVRTLTPSSPSAGTSSSNMHACACMFTRNENSCVSVQTVSSSSSDIRTDTRAIKHIKGCVREKSCCWCHGREGEGRCRGLQTSRADASERTRRE